MSLREPFLDERSYVSMRDFREKKVVPKLRAAIAARSAEPEDLANAKRRLFSSMWQVALLNYSGSQPLNGLGANVRQAIDAFDAFIDDDNASLDHVDLAIQGNYVEALWLLSMAKLLNLGEDQIERIANFYATDESNDGADRLFEIVLAKLGRKSFEADDLLHPEPYEALLECTQADPVDRPALMAQFLKRWFKGQKDCDWWGSHVPRKGTTVLDTGFFGYWAFEAALVTYLWDIDDSTYRDLPHYPKDLIDYARRNALQPADGQPPGRVLGGEPCPRGGWWFTPARPNSRQSFKQGQAMPVVGGTWGATIWQWDDQQG